MIAENEDVFLKLRDVVTQTGMCRTKIYEKIKAGEFPKQIKIGTSSRWSQADVRAWKQKVKLENGIR